MGHESFLARVDCPSSDCTDAMIALLRSHGALQDSGDQTPGTSTWKLDVGEAIIECEVRARQDKATTVVRFALCQPDVVVDAFIGLVRALAEHVKCPVTLMEDVAPELYQDIEGIPTDRFDHALRLAIHQKQREWDKEFGAQRMKASVSEAIIRFFMSR